MLIACFRIPGFAVACERALNPELSNQPLALADSDGHLQAVSDDAACKGVGVGQTASAARVFCRDLVVRPYERRIYEEEDATLWDRFARESSFVEPVSPELCFVEFSGPDIPERLQTTATDAAEISRAPVYTGLASSKFTARIAACHNVPGRVISVPKGSERKFLAGVAVDGLPSLNADTRDRLKRLGVRTLGDVMKVEERDLYRLFREAGMILRRLAQGADGDKVAALWPHPVIEHAVRFEYPISETHLLHEALRCCAVEVGDNLLRIRKHCRRLTIVLESETGSSHMQSEELRKPENAREALFKAALRLLHRATVERCKDLSRVLLRASALGTAEGVQLALLDDNESLRGLPHERSNRLEATLDHMRRHFGSDMITKAVSLSSSHPIRLWTYPLTRRLNEAIEVATDRRGNPMRYLHHGRWLEVERIQNRWAEADWLHGYVEERMVFRVETDTAGLSELRRCGPRWQLTAVAD